MANILLVSAVVSNIFKRSFLLCAVIVLLGLGLGLGLGLLVVMSVPPLFHSWQSFALESSKSNTSIGG